MSALSAWILSVLGIAVTGAVIDLVLPVGKMNKYVKSVFAAVTVLVIILPLPNLVSNGCSSDEFIFDKNVELDESYLEYAESFKRNSILNGLKKALEADGITLGEIDIEGDFSGAVPQITAVKINLGQVVIVGQSTHINNYELIRNKTSEYLAVDKDVIVIYESRKQT